MFIERALQVTRAGGLVSLIVPNKLGSAGYARGARQVLGINNLLLSIRDYSHVRVFPVAVYPIVFVAQKVRPSKSAKLRYERMEQNGNDVICVSTQELEYGRYFLEAAKPWQIFSSISKTNIAGKMSSRFPKLDSCATVLGAATVSEAYEIAKLIQDGGRGLKVANSGTIDRFHFLWSERECRYLGRSYLKPIISDACLRKLPTKRLEQAKTPKIIVAGMTLRLECALDLEGEYSAGKSTSVIFPRIHLCYLLGVLNSRAVQYFYSSVFGGNKLQGGYLRVGPPQLREIPIPVLDLSNETDKACHDRMVALVEQMLAAQKQLAAARSDADKDFYGNKCAGLDRQIDALVYELYGLNEAEIKLVETSNR